MKLYRLSALILSCLFLGLGSANAQGWDEDDLGISIKKVEKRAYSKYIKNDDKKEYRFTENTIIAKERIIDGNVVVVKGNLTIEGEIDGDVLIIMGNARIKSQSSVSGNVTCINGRIFQDEKSVVLGNQIETKIKNLFPRRDWDDKSENERPEYYFDRFTGRFRDSYSTLPLGRREDDAFIARYNRVQGMFLGLSIPKQIRGKYNFISVHGFAGYGFKEKKWRYELGIDRWLFNQKNYRFELGAKVYDLTDTKDNWIISPLENSLAAFFLNRDFQDFYRRHGYEFHASQNLTIFFKGTVGYRNDQYESLEKNTNWSLFGGKKDFRENPFINPGEMRSVFAELYLDTRNNIKLPRSGWFGKLSMETSNSNLSSDFSFNQYIFELRRYQKIGRYEQIDVRLKAATSEGDVPLQKRYQLGGISTLRGFDFRSLTGGESAYGGDRMILANFEYNISPRLLSSGLFVFDEVRYILFFDVGNVWRKDQVTSGDSWQDGFSHLQWNDMKSDFGVALTSWSGRVRFSIAKRTDTSIDPIVLTFRLSKPF